MILYIYRKVAKYETEGVFWKMNINVTLSEEEVKILVTALYDANKNYAVRAKEYAEIKNFAEAKKLHKKIDEILTISFKIESEMEAKIFEKREGR